jgi:hypothetical protein
MTYRWLVAAVALSLLSSAYAKKPAVQPITDLVNPCAGQRQAVNSSLDNLESLTQSQVDFSKANKQLEACKKAWLQAINQFDATAPIHRGLLFFAFFDIHGSSVYHVGESTCVVTDHSVSCGKEIPMAYFMLDDGRIFEVTNGVDLDLRNVPRPGGYGTVSLLPSLNPVFIRYVQLPDKDGSPVIHLPLSGLTLSDNPWVYVLNQGCGLDCKNSIVITDTEYMMKNPLLKVADITTATFKVIGGTQ